jgi:hypothetical protein
VGGAPKKRKNAWPSLRRFKCKKAPLDPLSHANLFYYNLTKYLSVSVSTTVKTGNVLHQSPWSSFQFCGCKTRPARKGPSRFCVRACCPFHTHIQTGTVNSIQLNSSILPASIYLQGTRPLRSQPTTPYLCHFVIVRDLDHGTYYEVTLVIRDHRDRPSGMNCMACAQ